MSRVLKPIENWRNYGRKANEKNLPELRPTPTPALQVRPGCVESPEQCECESEVKS